MISLNKVVIAGHLTRDPQARQSRDGTNRAGLSVAVNHAFRNPEGQTSVETSFVNVTVWAAAAERCLGHLRKGMPVLVEGRLRISKFEAGEGRPRYYTEIVAENVTFLSRPDEQQATALADGGGSQTGPVDAPF
ncbi:MAG TPA: single-stranded DNA-binding protein [Candidatus Ozemobacteraceae bacterium]|nr:single-stranded DNA-binding protein [Candidatus Ozemobacteraceae bacterium]